MSGKHLCQSRLSAAYISSNRYMHIILFYFIFVYSFYFPQGYPSSVFLVLHPALLRSSFVLPSSFIRLFHILHPALFQPSFIFLHLTFLLPFHCSPPCLSNWPLPVFSNVHPLRHSLCSPRHSSSRLRHSRLSPPSFQFSSSSFPARPGIPLPSGASPPCHPERQRRIFPHGFLHNN